MLVLAVAAGGVACSANDLAPTPAKTTPANGPLRYSRKVHLAGLDETVTLVKIPGAAWVEHADGRRSRVSDIAREDKQRLFARFGVADYRLRKRLEGAAPNLRIPVVAWYDPLPTKAATSAKGDEIAQKLAAAGLTIKSKSTVVSFVHAEGTAASIRELTHVGWLRGLLLDEPVRVRPQASDPVPYSQADTAFWSQTPSVKGHGQKVGILEAVNNSCQVFSEHAAFASGSVHQSNPGPACDPDPQKDLCAISSTCGEGIGTICQSGRCVGGHETAVAGVVAEVAPEVNLYVANNPGMWPVTFAGIEEAYKHFLTDPDWTQDGKKVTIVNESFFADDPGVQGIIENAVARSDDVLVTLASGNEGYGEAGTIADACPYNPNALAHTATIFSTLAFPIGQTISTGKATVRSRIFSRWAATVGNRGALVRASRSNGLALQTM